MKIPAVSSLLIAFGFPFLVGFASRLCLYALLVIDGEMPLGILTEYGRFFRYDALWHWEIMKNGYASAAQGNTLVSHYSLVWPLIMRAVSIFAGEDKITMMILNCVFFGLATSALAKMARISGLIWWKPVAFMCCFPTAFFSNSVYNEPLFMLATVISVSAFLEKRPISSGVWAGLSVAIRVNGWAQAAAVILSVENWRNHKKTLMIILASLLVAASVQPLAIWYWRGSPTAHYGDLKSVEWMASPQIIPFKEPVETVIQVLSQPSLLNPGGAFMFHRGWSAVALLLCVIVLALSWRDLPRVVKLQGAFTILGLGLLEQSISLPRYAMAFLPFYFWSARLPPWALGALCAVMAWVQFYLGTRFVRGLWAF